MALVFSDNFTGVSGTALNGRTGTGGSGAWTGFGVAAADQNGLKINAVNQARVATSNGCLARVETGAADHYAKAALYVNTAVAAVAVRATDHLNFLGFRIVSSTQVELFKRVNSATEGSVVKVTVGAITLPATLELRASGSNALLFLNGAQVGAAGGYAIDPAIPASTKAGLWGKSSATDPFADDFEAGTLATALTPAAGRGAGRDRGQGVAVALGLAAAGARVPGRAQAGALAAAAPAALVPASARVPGRGGAPIAVGQANAALAPAAVRASGRAQAGAVGLTLGIAAAGGRSAGRGGTASAAIQIGIGLTSARSAARGGIVTAGLVLALGPAGARSVARGGAAALAGAAQVAAAGARLPGRTGAAMLAVAAGLVPAGSRVASRAQAAAAMRFMAGFQTPVAGEARTVPVHRP